MVTGASVPAFAEGQKDVTGVPLRPTDAGGGIDGLQHTLPQLYNSIGGNFVMHWTNGADGGDASDAPDPTDSDSDGTPDFVEDFAAYFEESYAFEVTGRGFSAPPGDAAESNDANNRNPDGKYDVFIYQMTNYGYTNAELYPNTTSYGYIGVDNDYFGFPPNQDPDGDVKGAMKITAAHTFFHAIQFAYDTGEEVWWMETTGTYMEDEVYPATNDVYNYSGHLFEYSDTYGLETVDGTHEYANFIFAKRLSEDFGDGVIRAIWEEMKTTDGLTAIDNVLASNGSSLVEEFNRFTIANFFLEEMYDDGVEYRAAIAGSTTFGGVWREYEYNEATNGTPFTIDISNVNYNAWMNTWAADYITLEMSGAAKGYRITFDGFNNSVNYDVSVVTKAGGVISAQDFILDANKYGSVDLPYDAAYTDVVLVIRNSGSINTTDPSWKVSIDPLFVPPENTAVDTYTNSSDVPIPDNDGWVSSTITVPLSDNGTIKDMLVYVGIDHPFIGDLDVDLTSPEGTMVRLHAGTSNDSSYNIYIWYDNETVPDGPGVLDDFNGEGSKGAWTLSVSDNYAGDVGFIDTWSMELYVDRPPTVTITSPQNTTYQNGSINLSVFADKVIDTWWYTLNAGPNVTFTPNATIVGQVGSNTLVVYANDTTGKTGSSTVYFAVDTVPPDTTITSAPPDPSGTSSATFEFTSTETGSTFDCELDGSGYSNCTSPKSYAGLPDGTHTFNVRATDQAGNTDPSPASYSWTIDIPPPPSNQTTYNVTLLTGWNLISLPLVPENTSIDAVLASIEGNYSVVYAWIDGGPKQSGVRPPLGLTEMTVEYGYWIYMTAPDILELSGTVPVQTTINVSQGWNLVGYPFDTAQNLTDVLSPINYTVVYAWIDGGPRQSGVRPPLGLTEMSPGYGYWVYVNGAGSYVVGNITRTTYNVTLSLGWNLISLPLVPDDTSLDAVLASIAGNYTVVYALIDGGWKQSGIRPPLGLTEMTVEYGYLIYMSAPDILELSGTVPVKPVQTTITIVQSWNLVGYPSNTTRNLTDVLSPINYSVVYALIDGGWKQSGIRPPLGLTEMTVEYGYLIYMSAPDILELSGTVPVKPVQTTITIVQSWNLVGYPSNTTRNLTDVLSPINYSVVYALIDGGWKQSGIRPPLGLTEMSPGYGYQIYANGAGSYDVIGN